MPAASIARNLGSPRGAPVVAGDIRAYALAGHPPCGGRGYTVAGGAAVPCKCATKRFLAANPRVILDDAGGAWWPAEIPPGGDQ